MDGVINLLMTGWLNIFNPKLSMIKISKSFLTNSILFLISESVVRNSFYHNSRINLQNFLQEKFLIFRCDVQIIFKFRKNNQTFCTRSIFVNSAPQGFSFSDFGNISDVSFVKVYETVAVSYTHLDVYKRQLGDELPG